MLLAVTSLCLLLVWQRAIGGESRVDSGTAGGLFGDGPSPSRPPSAAGAKPAVIPSGEQPAAAAPPSALPATAPAAENAKKWPAPAPAALQAARQRVEDVYRDRLAKSTRRPDQAELARQMLQTGADTTDDPDACFVLLGKARDLAAAAGDAATTSAAIDALAGRFEVDRLAMEHDAFLRLAKSVTGGDEAKDLVTRIDVCVDELTAAERFPAATELANRAYALARQAGDPELLKRQSERERNVQEAANWATEARAASAALQAAPADPQSNLKWGRYLCFVKGDWSRGIGPLARAGDAALQAAAKTEAAGDSAADPQRQCAIADAWWDLAQKSTGLARRAMSGHAAELYGKAAPDLKGLNLARVQTRLKQFADASGTDGGGAGGAPPRVVPAGRPVNLLTAADPARDAVSGHWEKSGGGLSTNSRGAVLVFPYRPKGDYELDVTVTRLAGTGDINLIVPVGPNAADRVLLGHNEHPIMYVEYSPKSIPSTAGVLTNGRPYAVKLIVKVARNVTAVSVAVDGNEMFAAEGPVAKFDAWNVKGFGIVDEGLIYIRTNAPVTVSACTLRMLSGQAVADSPAAVAK